jgi:hypothetical protein
MKKNLFIWPIIIATTKISNFIIYHCTIIILGFIACIGFFSIIYTSLAIHDLSPIVGTITFVLLAHI